MNVLMLNYEYPPLGGGGSGVFNLARNPTPIERPQRALGGRAVEQEHTAFS